MVRRSRRFVQFRLRTLLLLTTLCALGLGFYHIKVRPYLRQHEAGVALSAMGLKLVWRPARPAWLMTLPRLFLDDEMLRECVAIHAEHCRLRDSDLKHVRAMTRLQRLYLAGNPIGDQGLEHLRDLQALERLSLWGTNITDDGLRHIGRLKALKVLDIHAGYYAFGSQSVRRPSVGVFAPLAHQLLPPGVTSRLSSQCLKHLRGATNLRTLYFSFTLDDDSLTHLAALPQLRIRTLMVQDVTSTGFSVLPQFHDLETLWVERSSIGAGNLWYLTQLPNLRQLYFERIQAAQGDWRPLSRMTRLEDLAFLHASIRDRGLKHLGVLCQLQTLSLRSARVTDRGVAHLSGLIDLRELDLRETRVTADVLSHLLAMRRLEALGLHVPLDDEAVEMLSRLPSLTRLLGPPSHEAIDLYLTDAGAMNLAGLRFFKRAFLNVSDAVAGTGLDGIDVPMGSGTITNTGLARLLETPCSRGLHISGRDITASGLRWGSQAFDCRYLVLKSPRPAAEVVTQTLEIGVGSAEFEYWGLRVETVEGIGPRRVDLHCGKGGFQLNLLRYLPTIKRLKVAVPVSPDRDWDNLRFVSGLEELEMKAYRASGSLVGAVAIRRLGEMRDLRRLTCVLPSGISPAALAPLGRLKKLEYLELHCGPLNTEHLQVLSQLTSLKTLRILGAMHSLKDSASLRHLTGLTQLTELWLYGIKDAGMPFLGEMKNLTRLSLKNHFISSEAFKYLEDLPELEYLDARASHRTMPRSRLRSLDQRLPKVRVRTD